MDFINMEKNLDETQREKSDILNGLIEAEYGQWCMPVPLFLTKVHATVDVV